MSGVGVSGVTPPAVEEIIPGYDWTEDPNGHYLIIDLPGFKKEQVKIQIFSSGTIKVRGERPVVNANKQIRFEQDFKVPENSDSDAIGAKFDGEILYITVPKHKVEEKKEPEPELKTEPEPKPAATKDQGAVKTSEDKIHEEKPEEKEAKKGKVCKGTRKERRHRNAPMIFTDDTVRRWEGEPSYLRSAMGILRENKGIVVTAILAFSLGMLISRKFEAPNGE